MRQALLCAALFIVVAGCATAPSDKLAVSFVYDTMLPMARECVAVHGACCMQVSLRFTASDMVQITSIEEQCERTMASYGLTVDCQVRATVGDEMSVVMAGPLTDCPQ